MKFDFLEKYTPVSSVKRITGSNKERCIEYIDNWIETIGKEGIKDDKEGVAPNCYSKSAGGIRKIWVKIGNTKVYFNEETATKKMDMSVQVSGKGDDKKIIAALEDIKKGISKLTDVEFNKYCWKNETLNVLDDDGNPIVSSINEKTGKKTYKKYNKVSNWDI